jgi:hypothetical protein
VNLNADTAKNDSRAKLVGMGFGACTKASPAGCVARKRSIVFGCGSVGRVALKAFRNSVVPSTVRAGKLSVEWPMMSVCTCSAR